MMENKVFNKKSVFLVAGILILVAILVGTYNTLKPLPEGINFKGEVYEVYEENLEFLYDLTYMQDEERIVEQEIFKEIFELIEGAEKFILMDFFLFNEDFGDQEHSINLTSNLTDLLVKKKEELPEIEITLITDPINNFYGSYEASHLSRLENAGINLIITDLKKLRDSNPAYSGFWRSYVQWFGTSGKGWISHPLGNKKHKVTLRSVLKVLNAKANHRKVVVADSGEDVVSVITSGNPHNASSLHSNIAFKIKGNIWKDILKTEQSVAGFSKNPFEIPAVDNFSEPEEGGEIQVQLLTEGMIRSVLIEDINSTEEGGEVDMAMFYLSDRKIIKSLLEASDGGVSIRIILDPNKDAFAREKNGIPNRQVAYELHKKSEGNIKIRWYDTYGEQFHTKMTVIKSGDEIIAHGGSANLTGRNLNNLNLETNIRTIAKNDYDTAVNIKNYFERLWENKGGNYTLNFEEKYKETSRTKYWIYRFQEWSGISTF